MLGAQGVQILSRFAASIESSLHINFKNAIVGAKEGDTIVTLKKLTPVRMLKNNFFSKIQQAENDAATEDRLVQLLGQSRAKKGMFNEDLDEGELEIGQVSASIKNIQPAAEILTEIWQEYNRTLRQPVK